MMFKNTVQINSPLSFYRLALNLNVYPTFFAEGSSGVERLTAGECPVPLILTVISSQEMDPIANVSGTLGCLKCHKSVKVRDHHGCE